MNEKTEIPTFQDRLLTCFDCNCEFTFTSGEQQFFWSKGLIEPKRCPNCRKLRKATIASNSERNSLQ